MKQTLYSLFMIFFLFSCQHEEVRSKTNKVIEVKSIQEHQKPEIDTTYNNQIKTIHVKVALCDNKYQGIVPVPKQLGNGQNPKNNLYWGAMYGVKTYFKKSKNWRYVKNEPVEAPILERLIFQNNNYPEYYLIADAYDGKFIQQATNSFLKSAAGLNKSSLLINSEKVGLNGNASLVAYIGHNGLMDFQIKERYTNKDGKQRDIIALACYSKSYMQSHLSSSNSNSIVWSTGLMAPEAYILHDALNGYVQSESNEQIRSRAAKAYSNYQKCSLKAARNLLVTN